MSKNMTAVLTTPQTGSHYIAGLKMPWEETEYEGFWLKRLYEDTERGEKPGSCEWTPVPTSAHTPMTMSSSRCLYWKGRLMMTTKPWNPVTTPAGPPERYMGGIRKRGH